MSDNRIWLGWTDAINIRDMIIEYRKEFHISQDVLPSIERLLSEIERIRPACRQPLNTGGTDNG